MKRTISLILILGFIASVSPVAADSSSTPLDTYDMSCMIGGDELDCEKIAAGAYAVCVGAGGGWLACTIVAAGAYLGCVAANAIIPE
jgi:hypothetical protein